MRAIRPDLIVAVCLAVLRFVQPLEAQSAPLAPRAEPLVSAQRALAEELVLLHHGDLVRAPTFVRDIRRALEQRTGLAWRGPDPLVVLTSQFPEHVRCDGGRCDARLESVRAIDGADSTVASVVVLSAQSLLSDRVWAHELMHALLMQHGYVAESARHDPRWFPRVLLSMR